MRLKNMRPENVIAVILLAASLLLVVFLSWHFNKSRSAATHPVSSAAPGGDKEELEHRYYDLTQIKNNFEHQIETWKVQITNKKRSVQEKMRSHVLGEEPSWYHFYDHWQWSVKKATYDKTTQEINELNKEVDDLQRKVSDRPRTLKANDDELSSIKAQLDNWRDTEWWISLCHLVIRIWNGFVAPVLHILLIIAIFGFMIRVSVRLALINGWLGTSQV